MTRYLVVAFGGALGAITRFALNNIFAQYSTTNFPYATFVINITGSFIIGFFLTLATERMVIDEHLRLAVAVGFVGAYTTFSTFEFEILKMIEANQLRVGIFYILASVIIGFIAVWGGMYSARKVTVSKIETSNLPTHQHSAPAESIDKDIEGK